MPDSPPTPLEAASYLAAIVESSEDAIISKNLLGIIQTWNPAAEAIFGYSPQEAIGQAILLIIPPELHHEEAMILARLRDGQRIDHHETVRRRKDGRLIDVALTISPIRDAAGTIIGASKIARDITRSKQAQRALAEAQARLTATLMSIGDAVLATDPQSRVTYLNAVAERLLGYSAQQAIGQPLDQMFRIVNADSGLPVENPVARVLREGTVVGLANHTILVRPDGTRLPIDDSAAPILDQAGDLLGIVLVFRDVSDRYIAVRQAALLSAIVASSDDAIISKDLTGSITSWNRGAEQIFGYTAEEMVGTSILRIIPQDRQSEEADILARLRRGERIDHFETVRQRKDGEPREISLTISPLTDEEGRIIGASKIARDITDRKRAQRALYEEQERWRVTLESIGDAVIVTDPLGVVTFANVVAADILGRPHTDLIGCPLSRVFTIINEETRQPVDNPVDRVIRHGAIVGLANHSVVVRPDGREIPIDDSAAPVRDHREQLVGVVLIFRDVTDRREAELQLQRWNAELETRVRERTTELVDSQERLRRLAVQLGLTEQRERRRLAANLHDYLAQLLALAHMKLGQTKRQLTQDVGQAERMLEEMDSILQQSLRFTRTLMAELSPSVLSDLGLVPALRWLADQLAQQGLTVDIQFLTDAQPAFEDTQTDLLFQAVRELLTNVLKHAGVSTARVSVDKREDEVWTVTVEDSGAGFDMQAVHHRPPGEHFGLFNIQERMEAMSGWCRIDSVPGRGTTVELGFPTRPAEESKASLSPQIIARQIPVVGKDDRQRWRVLLVDDHAMVRQGLRSILDSYPNLEVIAEATDGEEAVEFALRLHPDVVLMDINLPRLNGIDATRRIKRDAPNIVVIGLSVHASSQAENAITEAGAAALLSKELAADDLYRTIMRCVSAQSH